jgi:hypothetical protein
MRLALILAAIAAVSTLAAVPAEAQSRKPLRVKVEGRSFLDAGKIVPVGTYGRHLNVANGGGSFLHTGNIGDRGRENLPDRFAGPNPFANSFYSPSLR